MRRLQNKNLNEQAAPCPAPLACPWQSSNSDSVNTGTRDIKLMKQFNVFSMNITYKLLKTNNASYLLALLPIMRYLVIYIISRLFLLVTSITR